MWGFNSDEKEKACLWALSMCPHRETLGELDVEVEELEKKMELLGTGLASPRDLGIRTAYISCTFSPRKKTVINS